MHHQFHPLILVIFMLFLPRQLPAQESSETGTSGPRFIRYAGVGLHSGFIFAHNKLVQNTKGSFPWGVEADLSRQILKSPVWDECRCFPRSGLVLSYFDFGNVTLGRSFSAGIYIEPFLSVRHRVNICLKGVAGASYLSHPFDETSNPDNNSYSTYLSVYLAFGLGASVKVSEHTSVKLSAFYNHHSNGAVKEPNSGINWPAVNLHVYYALNPVPFPEKKKTPAREFLKKPWRKEIVLLASQRYTGKDNKSYYFIAGAGLNIGKQVSGMNALTAGFEAVADYSLHKRLEQDGRQGKSFIQAGILAGHEFLMGRFTFSQQLGVYVFNETPYFDAVYQRYGLTLAVSRHLGLGLNAKVHRHVAAFLDGRVVWRW